MHLFNLRRDTFNCLLASIISILCYNVAADALKKADALLWFAPCETLSRCLAFLSVSFNFLHLLIYIFTDWKNHSVFNVIAMLHSSTFGKVGKVWS